MEPATIVSGVMAILVPYVAKGARELVETVGEVGYQKAGELMKRLKARFAGDREAETVIEMFEAKPERYEAAVEEVIAERVAADPELARELTEQLEQAGPALRVFQEMDTARNVTGIRAGALRSGNAEVTQKARVADGMTGIDISGTIG